MTLWVNWPARQTNLAVKAVVGQVTYSALIGQKNYQAAQDFVDKTRTDCLGTDSSGTRFLIQYDTILWCLVYNHYPDLLFGLNVFPNEADNATAEFSLPCAARQAFP